MTTIFLELWHDLREKRLWPVAVGLLAALVAAPVLLFKPASQPGGAPLPPPHAPAGPQLPVVSVDSSQSHASRLDSFSSRDPFKPISQLAASTTTASSTSASSAAAAGASAAASGGSASGNSGSPLGGGSTVAPASVAKTSGGGGGGGSVPAPQTSASGSAPVTTTPKLRFYRWVIKVSFGAPGHEKKGTLREGNILPYKKNPVVMFLGVSATDGRALFLVPSSNVYAYGKADCTPPGATCHVLWLDPKKSPSESFAEYKGSGQWNLKLLSISSEQFTPKSQGKQGVKGSSVDNSAAQAAALSGLLSLSDVVSATG